MNVFICDDDRKDIARLKALIDDYDMKNHIGFTVSGYRSGMEMLEAVRKGKSVDIIFLDINMDIMDGLTVARKIRELREDVPIILVTTFMNYALDGYKVRASRFLIKDDLDKTFPECMDDICGEIRKRSNTVIFPCVEGEIKLKASDIILFETSGHKCLIQLRDRTYQIYEKLENNMISEAFSLISPSTQEKTIVLVFFRISPQISSIHSGNVLSRSSFIRKRLARTLYPSSA